MRAAPRLESSTAAKTGRAALTIRIRCVLARPIERRVRIRFIAPSAIRGAAACDLRRGRVLHVEAFDLDGGRRRKHYATPPAGATIVHWDWPAGKGEFMLCPVHDRGA